MAVETQNKVVLDESQKFVVERVQSLYGDVYDGYGTSHDPETVEYDTEMEARLSADQAKADALAQVFKEMSENQ